MDAGCGDHVWTLVEIARSVSLTTLFWSLAEQLRLDRVEIARNVSLIRLSKVTWGVEISRIVSLLGLSWRLDEFGNLLKLTSELPVIAGVAGVRTGLKPQWFFDAVIPCHTQS